MRLFQYVTLLSVFICVHGIRFDGMNKYLNIERSLYRFPQHPVERQRVIPSPSETNANYLSEVDIEDEAPHSRYKRTINYDEADANKKIETSNVTFQENHQLAYIAWSGKSKSDTIVTLFRDIIVRAGSTSSVYVSHDYGKSYNNLTAVFRSESGFNVRLDGFLDSPDDYRDYIFFSLEDKSLFTSRDEARTFHYHKLSFTPSDLITHPTKGDILVAYDMTDHQAYISLDFGEHWKAFSTLFPGESIGGVYWGAEFGQNGTLYVAAKQSNGLYDIYKTDLHLTNSSALFPFPVHEFDIADEYMYAVRVKSGADASKSLLVSFDRGSFQEAQFSSVPDDPLARLLERSYYVADGSEGQLVVAVNHQYNLTNLYISESRGVRFSLSLERVLYHDPNLTDVSSSWVYRVRDTKLLDFHKAGGLRGIYIATQLTIGSVGGRYLRTFISYDKGGEWSRIAPPTRRYDNRTIACSPPSCYLNLASEFSSIYRSYKTEPILSKNSTPGVIMATGSPGRNLYVIGDLMVSNTAGASWSSALPGLNYYQFGDNGGFMIATRKYYYGLTNFVYYSLDEGSSWQKYRFSQQPLLIWGLLTEPGEYTSEVALYGSTSYYRAPFEWVVVRIDLKGILGRPCARSDYKLWSPSDDIPDRSCLLGSRLQYERKRAEVQCYQGLNFTRNVTSQLCPCARIDYECDLGFDLEEGDNTCRAAFENPVRIPDSCSPYGSYPRSQGYRKVAGDRCTGEDIRLAPVDTPCPGGDSHFHLDVSGRGLVRDELFSSIPDHTQVLITAHIYNLSQLNHSYLWSVDNQLIRTDSNQLNYTFSQAKTYLVSLVVSSRAFTASNSTLVRVLDKIDPSRFSVHTSFAYINLMTQVSVLLPANIDNYGLLTFTWTWQDGGRSFKSSTLSPSQNISFQSAGAHQVCLTLSNAISSANLSPCSSVQAYPSLEVSRLTGHYLSASLQLEWTPPSPLTVANYYSVVDVSRCQSVDLSHCCSTAPPCCRDSRTLRGVAAYGSVVLPHVEGNYTYKLVVVARNSDKSYCTHSSLYQTSTGQGVPGPPSIDSGSQLADSITLSWSPPAHANGELTGYQVLSYIGNMPVLNTQRSQFSQQSAQLRHLWPSVLYSFYLQARTAKGYGLASTRPLNVMSPSSSSLPPIILETPDDKLASYSHQELERFMGELSNSVSSLGEIFSPVMLSNHSLAFLFKPNQSGSASDLTDMMLSALKTFSYNGIYIVRAYKSNYTTVENIITTPGTNPMTTPSTASTTQTIRTNTQHTTPSTKHTNATTQTTYASTKPTTQTTQAITNPTNNSSHASNTQVIISSSNAVGFIVALMVAILLNIVFILLILILCISLRKSNRLRKQRYAVLTNFNAEEEEVTVNGPGEQAEDQATGATHTPYSIQLGHVTHDSEDDPMLEVNTSDVTPLLS